jgi:tetratricopeptide (TPR) repeat protein
MALYYARQYTDAIAELEAATQMDPQFEVARFGLARVYESMERPREALAQLESLPQRNDSAKQAELARVYAILGERDSARAIVKTLEDGRRSGKFSVAPENLAYVYLALGERQRALTLLDEAYAERSPGMCWLKVDPRFDELRDDPRFTRLLARLGLNK